MSMLFQLLLQSITHILYTVLDALYPRRCPVCDQIVLPKDALICPTCFPKLSYIKSPVYKKCGKQVFSDTVEYCFDYTRRHHSFEYGLALINYDDYARHSMAAIKYKNKRRYLDFYAEATCQRYTSQIHHMNAQALIPVPIHPSGKRQHGFNQAELLTSNIGARLGIPAYPLTLLRDKKILPQKQLNPSGRLKNLQQVFRSGVIPPDIINIILVDDIYTTDNTVEACARVFLSTGVRHVYIITICIGHNA